VDPELPPRVVTLVLVTPQGEVVGQIGPLTVDVPWWQEAGPVVRAARDRFGVDVTILRLLESERPAPHGGAVTYLAEVGRRVRAAPWRGTLDDHPLRMPWARPGGPDRDLAWADEVLRGRGIRRIGPAEQVRSWNLSSMWCLPVQGQTAWLKVVPPFFAHEGPMLERLDGALVPALLAQDDGRILMPEIPGEDQYDAPLPALLEMVSLLVRLQRDWIGRTDELLGLGLPDWRAPALRRSIRDAVERAADELSAEDRGTLAALVDGLDDRLAAVAGCGLPDTLVHGDFFPGNVRGEPGRLVLLDWGDCGVGHPLLDEAAFLDRIPAEAIEPVRLRWHDAWRAAVPNADPSRASGLLAPVAAARQAVIYRRFLDAIEPSERPYHRADPAAWLHRTAELARSESAIR
jgi:hypothetical protein